MCKYKLFFFLCLFISPSLAQATLNFSSVSQGDFDNIVKELSADMSYSSVTPASSLGSVWGAELGVVAGVASTPDIQTIVNNSGTSSDVKVLPHAALLGRLGVPGGVTFEVMGLPSVNAKSVNYHQIGGALQWTLTDVVLTDFPFTLAVKGYYTKDHLDFSETINNSSTLNTNVSSVVNFDDTLYGALFLLSKKVEFFEPYGGIGYTYAKGSLGVNASSSATIFNGQSFPALSTTGQYATDNFSSVQYIGGLDIRFGPVCFGAEVERTFNRNSYNGRFSFRF